MPQTFKQLMLTNAAKAKYADTKSIIMDRAYMDDEEYAESFYLFYHYPEWYQLSTYDGVFINISQPGTLAPNTKALVEDLLYVIEESILEL